LSLDLNEDKLEIFLTEEGKEFQSRRAAIEKERRPYDLRF
jgi:hypothetical protein